MSNNNPNAIFDCLYIGQALQRNLQDFSLLEIQFFSYFSCLLSLYEGNSLDSWSYVFMQTESGSPYSKDIHESLITMSSSGLLEETKGYISYYQMSEKGQKYFSFMNGSLQSLAWRKKYLETACSSMVLMPIGMIKEAINSEPVLTSAQNAPKKNLLLETNPATRALYSQFNALKTALSDKYADLIVPAMVWLDALNQTKHPYPQP